MKFYTEATNPQLHAVIVCPSIGICECHGLLHGSWSQGSVAHQMAKHPKTMLLATINGF